MPRGQSNLHIDGSMKLSASPWKRKLTLFWEDPIGKIAQRTNPIPNEAKPPSHSQRLTTKDVESCLIILVPSSVGHFIPHHQLKANTTPQVIATQTLRIHRAGANAQNVDSTRSKILAIIKGSQIYCFAFQDNHVSCTVCFQRLL